MKTVCSDMYPIVEVFLYSQSGWCFEIVFSMILVLRTRPYLTFEKEENSVAI